jgi:hypothetical protein
MKTISKIKNLRPTETDGSFKYTCPNCSSDYWATLKQVRCKHFVIVCDCETVLKPKPIETIKIVYKKKKEKPSLETKKSEDIISSEILDRCCKTLISYGFDKEEAEDLIKKAYSIDKNADCVKLVKIALSNFGEKNG